MPACGTGPMQDFPPPVVASASVNSSWQQLSRGREASQVFGVDETVGCSMHVEMSDAD